MMAQLIILRRSLIYIKVIRRLQFIKPQLVSHQFVITLSANGKYQFDLMVTIFDENILDLVNYLERAPDAALVFPDYYLVDELEHIFS